MASNQGAHDATRTAEAVFLPASAETTDAQHSRFNPAATEPTQQATESWVSQGPYHGQATQITPVQKKTAIDFILDQPLDTQSAAPKPQETIPEYQNAQNQNQFGHYLPDLSLPAYHNMQTPVTLPPIKSKHERDTSGDSKERDLRQKTSRSSDDFNFDKRRPESMVLAPLTHPNGAFIFPHLSTAQQDELSRAALYEAEDTIVADSEEVSTLGDGNSDAGYESDSVTSGSTSMTSSIRDYMYENGRRYHRFREGTYNFPNDDVEQEREDMKHAMVKLLCNQKLNFAPIGDHPQEVLDIGTGTGIWAIEMGDHFSSANVLGIDLSPIQPDWLPPNVRFMVDDVESPWLHPRNHFDYIHTRHTVMAIKDWPKLFRRAFEHLKPGGWFEMQEIHHKPHSATRNGMVPPEHPVAKYWQLITEGLMALGVNFHAAAGGHLANMLREAGFVNVTERVFHVPLGTWPKNKVLKTVGLYWRTILMDGMQAIALGPLTRGLGWDREQVEMLLVETRKAYLSNSILMYMPCHIIYAQKPEYL